MAALPARVAAKDASLLIRGPGRQTGHEATPGGALLVEKEILPGFSLDVFYTILCFVTGDFIIAPKQGELMYYNDAGKILLPFWSVFITCQDNVASFPNCEEYEVFY